MVPNRTTCCAMKYIGIKANLVNGAKNRKRFPSRVSIINTSIHGPTTSTSRKQSVRQYSHLRRSTLYIPTTTLIQQTVALFYENQNQYRTSAGIEEIVVLLEKKKASHPTRHHLRDLQINSRVVPIITLKCAADPSCDNSNMN